MARKPDLKQLEHIESKYRDFLAATALAEDTKQHFIATRTYGRNNAFLTWSHEPYQDAIKAFEGLGLNASSKAIGEAISASMIRLFEEQAVTEGADPEVDAHLDSILRNLDAEAISEEVRTLIDRLFMQVKIHTVFVPVEGLVLQGLSEFTIGDVTVYDRASGPVAAVLRAKDIRERHKEIMDRCMGDTKCYAAAEIEGESTYAVQEAPAAVADAIKILNLVLASSYGRFQGYSKIRPIRRVASTPDRYESVLYAEAPISEIDALKTTWGANESTPHGHEYEVSSQALDMWRVWGLDTVVTCFRSPSAYGRVGSKIRQAVEWYSRGMNADGDAERFLAVAIALESLLVGERQGSDPASSWGSIGQQLADRIAFLVGDDVDHRIKLVKLTRELYGMRSRIVHAGKGVSRENLYRMERLFRSAFWALVDVASQGTASWDDFLAREERQRYSVAD